MSDVTIECTAHSELVRRHKKHLGQSFIVTIGERESLVNEWKSARELIIAQSKELATRDRRIEQDAAAFADVTNACDEAREEVKALRSHLANAQATIDLLNRENDAGRRASEDLAVLRGALRLLAGVR